MNADLGELVGLLLGAEPRGQLIASVESTQHDGTTTRFRLWLGRGMQFRLEQPGAPTLLQSRGSSLHIPRRGARETGPPMALHGMSTPLWCFVPRHGYFWGRPGEDWRLTTDVTVEDGLATVRLAATEPRPGSGHLRVELATGFVLAAAFGDWRWTVEYEDVLMSTEQFLVPRYELRGFEPPRVVRDPEAWVGVPTDRADLPELP